MIETNWSMKLFLSLLFVFAQVQLCACQAQVDATQLFQMLLPVAQSVGQSAEAYLAAQASNQQTTGGGRGGVRGGGSSNGNAQAPLPALPGKISLRDTPYFDEIATASTTLPRFEHIDRYFFMPFNLTVVDMTCSIVNVTDIEFMLDQVSERTGRDNTHAVDVTGLGTKCDLYIYWEYGPAWGEGPASASTNTPPDDLTMSFEIDGRNGEVGFCHSDLSLETISIDAGLVTNLINILERWIVAAVNLAVNEMMCAQMSAMVAQQAPYIQSMNSILQLGKYFWNGGGR